MKIGIIGATGAVGREMLVELGNSTLKGVDVVAMASPKSEGEALLFRGRSTIVKSFQLQIARQCDFILMSAGSAFSSKWAGEISQNNGPIVIDNSSAWRMNSEVPLIVPEVNGSLLLESKSRIIANPNCAMIQLAVSLEPLRKFDIKVVSVTTLQSVSGSGKRGIDELDNQIKDHLQFNPPTKRLYDLPIAFNLIPYIGVFDEQGHCEEENKIKEELEKVFLDNELETFVTTVRVPTFNCHSESVTVKLGQSVSESEVMNAFKDFNGIEYILSKNDMNIPSPASVVGMKSVYISRMRLPKNKSKSTWVQFWSVADNLKKGAATNAVQILECLVGN